MKKSIAVVIIALFMCLAVSPMVIGLDIEMSKGVKTTSNNKGNTLYVGGSGSDNYTRIQYAIDNASDGDTVFVYDDSSPYFENVYVYKSINLIGEDKNTTIIDGDRKSSVVRILADWVNISGFTIQNSSKHAFEGGIENRKVRYTHSTIMGNIFFNNYNGIFLASMSHNIIDNTFSFNKWRGISLLDSNWITIIGNTFLNNPGDSILLYFSWSNNISGNNYLNNFNGIHLSYSRNNIISGNTVLNSDNIGIWVHHDSLNNKIVDNTVLDNYIGIHLGSSDSNIISGNTVSNNRSGIAISDSNSNFISGNTISHHKKEGINIYSSSDNNITGNTISNNDPYGIYLSDSIGNNITDNNVSDNNYGIFINDFSNNNAFYHNNFIKNIYNAHVEIEDSTNTWDDGEYGNYWSDYEERYPDAKPRLLKRWMWNMPYEIPGGNNTDNCPLIKQWPDYVLKSITNNQNMQFGWLERFPILNRLFNRFMERLIR